MDNNNFPQLNEIQQAAEKIAPYIHQTPVITCCGLNEISGAEIYFKCENLQKVGAFKFRGATNAVLSLSEKELAQGVATHSSGNHAQALSLAAQNRGIKAYIVMPNNAPSVKVDAVRGYGGEITFCEPTLQAREETLAEIVKKTGATFIHPYNDFRIIAGQATAAMELIDEVKNLEIIIAPVGGGGLLSGTSLSTFYLSPETIVFGAEPEGADDAQRSFKSGKIIPSEDPHTIADGLLTSLGTITYPIIKKYVSDILTVSEENIILAMKLIWERAKIIIEPSAAVPFGVILQHKDKFSGKKVGIILSGGNIDLKTLFWH
jgi:threonine dehydratase